MLGKITERQCEQQDLLTWDGALASCCGQKGPKTLFALKLMAHTEGIMLYPVYTAKTFARVFGLLEEGMIKKGQKVLMLHTGGLPALFGYQDVLYS